jgi:hypothetical protein
VTNHPLYQTFDLARRGGRRFLTLLSFLWFAFALALLFFRFEIVSAGSPKALKKVVEGTDTGNVPWFEGAGWQNLGTRYAELIQASK